ncbi:MAG: hypothetical protein ACREIF_07730 [Chthoniobacterales bacterium]
MKTELRRALAQESFEEKIRKVGRLIQLSATVKTTRVREIDDHTADVCRPPSPTEEIPSGN